MILVDTSIWIDHLRSTYSLLTSRLLENRVFTHNLVIGELACGNVQNRGAFLTLMHALPRLNPATDAEVLFFIDQHHLMGRGIGYIDAHLLASTALHAAKLWTRDKRLQTIAETMGLGYLPELH